MLEKPKQLSSADKQMLRDRVLGLGIEIKSLDVDPRNPAGISSGFETVEVRFPVSGVKINFGRTPTDVEEGVNGDLEDITISIPPDSDGNNDMGIQYRLRRNGNFTYESVAFYDLDDGRAVIDRENDFTYRAKPRRGPIVNSPINEENVGALYSIIKTLEQSGRQQDDGEQQDDDGERQRDNMATVLYVNRWQEIGKGGFMTLSF